MRRCRNASGAIPISSQLRLYRLGGFVGETARPLGLFPVGQFKIVQPEQPRTVIFPSENRHVDLEASFGLKFRHDAIALERNRSDQGLHHGPEFCQALGRHGRRNAIAGRSLLCYLMLFVVQRSSSGQLVRLLIF
jgi:hypothetical protein